MGDLSNIVQGLLDQDEDEEALWHTCCWLQSDTKLDLNDWIWEEITMDDLNDLD